MLARTWLRSARGDSARHQRYIASASLDGQAYEEMGRPPLQTSLFAIRRLVRIVVILCKYRRPGPLQRRILDGQSLKMLKHHSKSAFETTHPTQAASRYTYRGGRCYDGSEGGVQIHVEASPKSSARQGRLSEHENLTMPCGERWSLVYLNKKKLH